MAGLTYYDLTITRRRVFVSVFQLPEGVVVVFSVDTSHGVFVAVGIELDVVGVNASELTSSYSGYF